MSLVSYKLYGGCRWGNVAFQIATTYAYARKHNIPYIIPVDTWGYSKHFPKVNYGTPEQIAEHANGATIIKEPTSQVHFNIPAPKENEKILLDGYLQSFKYFEDYRPEILDLFGFNQPTNKGVVAIHVRRGDYVKHSYSFPPCTMAYYKKAVEAMLANGLTNYLVFSDDIPYCKQEFGKTFGDKITINYSEGFSPIADLYRMASCDDFIVANSTYSLWGAWAGRSEKKVVIAPDKMTNFFTIKGVSSKDIYPDDWVQIKF